MTMPRPAARSFSAAPAKRAFWRRVVSETRTDDDFHRALALLKRHNAIERTLDAAREHTAAAKAALKHLPANAYNEALSEIADFVIERGY